MRMPFIDIVCVLLPAFLIDWRIWSLVKNRFGKKWANVYVAVNGAVFYGLFVASVFVPHRSGNDTQLLAIMWTLFGFISLFFAKLLFVAIDALGLMPKLWRGRRFKFFSWLALIMAGAVFCLMWWGALVNRFNIDVKRVELILPGLPDGFDGTRIVQISDLHVGTFGNDTTFVSQLVDSINALNPDVILFTGDIVNRQTTELYPFRNVLSRLAAPMGVYSVLGNHDYGDYMSWKSEDEKRTNIELLKKLQEEMGWVLLNDSTAYLASRGDSLPLVGVENIGDPPFYSYGNLKKAISGISHKSPWILMTHNPAHWSREVLKCSADSLPVALTLAGHTHAMQIELFGISPASLRYKQWGGLYENESDHRKMYVNIGTGTVGMPMRIGATPEITLFTVYGK